MFESMVPVLIVAIVFSFISFSVYMKFRTDTLRLGGDEATTAIKEENRELKVRVTGLEKRIQTLESIVTGKEFQLADEIDGLA